MGKVREWVLKPVDLAVERADRLDELDSAVRGMLDEARTSLDALDASLSHARSIAAKSKQIDALGQQVAAQLADCARLAKLLEESAKTAGGVPDEVLARVVEPIVRKAIVDWFARADRMVSPSSYVASRPFQTYADPVYRNASPGVW